MLSPDPNTIMVAPEQLVNHSSNDEQARSRYALAGLTAVSLLSMSLSTLGIAVPYPLSQGLLRPHTAWPPLVHFSLVAGLWHGIVYGLLIIASMPALIVVRVIPSNR